MKVWNKPIRVRRLHSSFGFGVTNWVVGTCPYPWSPWVQVSFGKLNVQIKYWLLVILLMVLSFLVGYLL